MRLLFSLAAFLGAFLLFCVQPMIAKMVMPQFGGAPAVWNTCMVFFQAALLAGYATAHAAGAWLSPRRQAFLQFVLLVLPLVALPIGLRGGASSSWGGPALRLLGLLLVSVGLPFLVVATTAPLIQQWFAGTGHRRADDPYFLYAASNAGSLLALVGYIGLIEPHLTLRAQTRLWTAGYAVFAILIIACGFVRMRATSAAAETTTRDPVAPQERGRWVALAFAPSSLLLGVTTYLSTDLAPVPMLWVVPLTLYLLSFIIAFANPPTWVLKWCTWTLPPAIVATLSIMVWPAVLAPWIVFLIHLATFFLAALACHIELARRRPPVSRLTEFYLLISLGGVLGGMFNALVAPVIFDSVAEYPLALILSAFLAPLQLAHRQTVRTRGWGAPVADVGWPISIGIVGYGVLRAWSPNPSSALLFVPSVACLVFVLRPLRFALALAIVTGVIAKNRERYEHVAWKERSFFGVLRVLADFPSGMNTLMHGRTIHGMQRRSSEPAARRLPLTYYFPTGPIGQVFASYRGTPVVNRVGVIGLGVGSLAAYGAKGQEYTFFEIDPAVEDIARNSTYFHYLDDCRAKWQVITGDARLTIARQPDHAFGLIVLDAFSGDAIPMHLLTREALQIYLSKLADGGLIALHISNNYLDLLPAVRDLAADLGLSGRQKDETGQSIPVAEYNRGRKHSQWVVLARQRSDLARLAEVAGWRPLGARLTHAPWTDDYSNLFEVLRWR